MSASSALSLAESAMNQARMIFAMDSPLAPVLNLIVGLLVAYVILYFITFYLGPALFGVRPYRPWPIVARTMHHVTRRAIDALDEDGAHLADKVTSSIVRTY